MSGFAADGGPGSLEQNAVEEATPYEYPRADVTVAKPSRGGNVKLKAKTKRLMRRGAISQDAAQKIAPDLMTILRRQHAYNRDGVLKDSTVEASSA